MRYRMVASLEESADRAAIDRALRENEAGDTIPGDVVRAILDGTPPLRAWRQHRRLTLDGLAAKVGVTKAAFADRERLEVRYAGSRALAAALDVTLDDLASGRDTDDAGD